MRLLLSSLFALILSNGTVLASESAERNFDTVIAPILSRHCLECHDTANREGKLDLSKKSAAFTTGKKNPIIVPGSAAKSQLWKSIERDEMPEDRPALSADEKEKLRAWINAGAVWPGEEIDPLAHMRSGGQGTILPRRLTRDEYIATVRAATGVEIAKEAERLLPADARAEGFRNTTYHLTVDLGHVQAYAELARLIAERLDPTPFLAGTKGADTKALETIVDQTGRRLFRGPLEKKEREAFLALAREGTGLGRDPKAAARLVVEAMLQSPRFVYRVEGQSGDGKPKPVAPHELASRLSYLAWGAPPDEALIRAAEAGELASDGGLSQQLDRLLADPRAVEQSLRFARDWLDLDRLESLAPNPDKFPHWSPALASDLKAETLAFFRAAVWEEKLPLSRLFNAPFTYATPRLASHYGFKSDLKGKPAPEPLPKSEPGPEPLLRYRFDEAKGDRIVNHGRLGSAYDLSANKFNALAWRKEGGLELKSPAALATKDPARELVAAIRGTREFTVSMRITPANTRQAGPARILTLSEGTGGRNLTLGQEGDRYEIRVRGKGTDNNGTIGWLTVPKTVKTEPVHLHLVREASGKTRLFLDGKVATSRDLGSDLGDWKDGYRLLLGNETSGDRPWLGTYHEIAVYDRALLPNGIPADRAAKERIDLSGGPEPLLRYRFDEATGDRIINHGRLGSVYDLRADKSNALAWRREGGLELKSPAALAIKDPARELVAAIRGTREFTVSMRVTPANTKQAGPARILTLSEGILGRNLTLGQEGDRYEIRVRGKGTDSNGTVGWQTEPKTAKTEPVYLHLVREASGKTRLFLDGREAASRDLGSDLGDWKDDYRLLLGNETSGDRPWLGIYHELAVYDRALLPGDFPSDRSEWKRIDLSGVTGRGGLLTQGSLLTIGGDDASMVARGLFVLHEILGSGVTSAPSGTDTTPIPPKAGQSRRAVSETRISKSDCAGCHSKFEPLAFGLEKFDALGVWREKDEHGNAQREDGNILFPGEARPVAFSSVAELMDLLAGSDRVSRTITRKATQFAIGRPLGNVDAATLETIHRRATESGGTWPALVKAIAQSDLIRLTPTEPKS